MVLPLLALTAAASTSPVEVSLPGGIHLSTPHLDLHLATGGSDGNDGSSAAKALATVDGAQAAVRKALAAGPQAVTVHIAPGIYTLSRPINMSLADAGPAGSSVAWTATASAPVEQTKPSLPVAPVVFSGGQRIKFAAAVGGLWRADVSRLPSKAVEHGRQLWVNDRRASRSTESGSYDCEKTSTSPCKQSKTLWGEDAWQITNTTVKIIGAHAVTRAKSWPNAGRGVEFVWSGVDNAAWAESRCEVQSVIDFGSNNGSDVAAVEVKLSPLCLSCWAAFKGQWPTKHKVAPPTAIEAIGKDQLNPGEW